MPIARESRRKVLIRASLYADGPAMDVCVRDISTRGLLIQASAPPPRGTYVELACGGRTIVGRIVWRKDRRFGVETRDRINVHALANGLASASAPQSCAPTRPLRAVPVAARTSGEAGRAMARAMEFALIGLFAATLVAALGMTAFQTLSKPFENVAAHLGR